MMRIMRRNGQPLAVAVVYAAAAVLFAFLSIADHGMADRNSHYGVSSANSSASLCVGLLKQGEKKTVEACCDACLMIADAGLPPPQADVFRLEAERATQIFFAQRFGHVSDATPDDLRSRAPPPLS